MKKHRKLLLFISILFTIPFFITPFVNAEEVDPNTGNVNYTWLSATVAPFDNLPTGAQRLVQEFGGYDLISFDNLGIISSDEETGIIIYKAQATFGFELNSYTAITVQDMYPTIDINRIKKYEYLC